MKKPPSLKNQNKNELPLQRTLEFKPHKEEDPSLSLLTFSLNMDKMPSDHSLHLLMEILNSNVMNRLFENYKSLFLRNKRSYEKSKLCIQRKRLNKIIMRLYSDNVLMMSKTKFKRNEVRTKYCITQQNQELQQQRVNERPSQTMKLKNLQLKKEIKSLKFYSLKREFWPCYMIRRFLPKLAQSSRLKLVRRPKRSPNVLWKI